MKFGFPTLFALLAFLMIGCAGEKESETQDSTQSTDQMMDVTTPQAIDPGTSVSGNTAGVFHYICPNNCEGSGGASAGNCPVCGTAYVHNTAFHQQQTGNSPNQAIDLGEVKSDPPPAQNASGVFHYVCNTAGCDGGGAQAGNCPKCGAALSHNSAFHQ